MEPIEHRHHGLFLLAATLALLPGAAYFGIVMIGLLFDNLSPAQWLVERVLTRGSSVPLLLAVVIGGPLLSVITVMIRSRGGVGDWLAGMCGAIAVLLILFNVLFGVFFLPFSFFLD